eukprot:CAMPEP_0194365372 /NCGR_PEP_ID=MMETSP0174-20130528/13401_1 /TAXON_ID=216777 /ORGANISM="Proboscia alata, Strain PI-D3" /LENGTH=352 /DNA_ID=CAMNT_0039140009 /DNA_START=47 /DNA_END=1105 /DNA_ORIENTATION=-
MTKAYTRSGVKTAVELVSFSTKNKYSTKVLDVWDEISNRYDDMISQKAATVKSSSSLVKLDASLNALAKKIRASHQNSDPKKPPLKDAKSSELCCVTKEELVEIVVGWKFAKGKPRYALFKHLNNNTDRDVEQMSANAFGLLTPLKCNDRNNADLVVESDSTANCKRALDEMTKLRGVGPATASAVLCLVRPDLFAFMDDEVIECLVEGKRGYTAKIYMDLNDKCCEIAKRLNDIGSNRKQGVEWSTHLVGKTLWTATQLGTMEKNLDFDDIYQKLQHKTPPKKDGSKKLKHHCDKDTDTFADKTPKKVQKSTINNKGAKSQDREERLAKRNGLKRKGNSGEDTRNSTKTEG